MWHPSRFFAALLLTVFSVAAAQGESRFERDVLPILAANCFSCHGGTAMIGLDLRTASSILRGSHEGPVVVKGSAEKSLLYQKVVGRQMPPAAFNLRLTDQQIATIKDWIDAGALSDETDAFKARAKELAEHFEKEALPVFQARCISCHGGDKPMAGLDLRTLAGVLKGSASGPVISEGGSDKSLLVRRVTNASMPPRGMGEPLSEEQIQSLRRWIDTSRLTMRESGPRETFTPAEARPVSEKDRQFWAFVKPVSRPIPKVKAAGRVRTPIDAFVLARLESAGLTLSPDAPKLTLLRRACLDLTGLPPSPEEITAFLSDNKAGAYERVIDRLLASPRYGERWGRHWLDAAGYTDSNGFDPGNTAADLFDFMWRYRDWVVRAVNQDKPYDRFLTEQLAGDELVDWRNAKKYTPEIADALIATGYLRSVYDRTDLDIVNLPGERYDVLFHLVEKVSTSTMGLTVGCARCHSHKYDPIPQQDYYRYLSIFTPGFNPVNWIQPKKRWLPDVSKADQEEIERHNADIDRPVKELNERLARIRQPYEAKLLQAKLQALPEQIRVETKQALETPKDTRDAVQQFLVKKFEKVLAIAPEEVDKALNEDEKAAVSGLEQQIKTFDSYRQSFGRIQALWDIGPPPKMRLLQRGEVENPGPRVNAGFPTVLCPPGQADIKPAIDGQTSGNRLALARWMTSADHPLTARVIVNRVWQNHFGRGIVETSDNFGRSGAPPTNPELLDWLAVRFMHEDGWSLKRMHKLIMTSTVYRQSSQDSGETASAGKKIDPENRLLWRMNLRRLEAESIRDSVLAASGQLDLKMGGPAIAGPLLTDGLQKLTDSQGKTLKVKSEGSNRRSIYILARRYYPLSFLETFDEPVIQTNCMRRTNSVSPLQSLALLNSDFIVEQASYLADRAVKLAAAKASADPIEAAFLLTVARPPTAKESEVARAHLTTQEELYRKGNLVPEQASKQAFVSLCHMLLGTSEFLYID